MNKHTPGPWRRNMQANTLRGAGDHFVCDMNDVASANARLIEAAPDLLEALREALPALEASASYAGAINRVRKARAAIAKAEEA
jgi:hypothetical protein